MHYAQPSPRFAIGHYIGHAIFAMFLILFILWTGTALSVHLSDLTLHTAWAVLSIGTISTLLLRWRIPRAGWIALLCMFLATATWYQTIRPSDDRIWAFDVAQGVKARVDGDIVHLDDVRDFTWKSETTAARDWENRSYDLTKLASVDMITSVWDNPDIAHLLVSFGFSDGEQVVFSVETRREEHETFNAMGGFFRQFELILIAASEEDIIKLRTNHRKEDVRLYPVNLNATQRRDLFMSYVNLAQQLENRPAFYNTLTANCTTSVYKLAQIVEPNIRPDWRVLLSGHLPDYIDAMGGFADDVPVETRMQNAAITAKAQIYDGSSFSSAIRK
ncbi:MAG: DUF4105 domain-containing protein [Litoreibacter sp.]